MQKTKGEEEKEQEEKKSLYGGSTAKALGSPELKHKESEKYMTYNDYLAERNKLKKGEAYEPVSQLEERYQRERPKRVAKKVFAGIKEAGSKLGSAVAGAAGSVSKFANSPEGKQIGVYLNRAGQRQQYTYGLGAFAPGVGTVTTSRHPKPIKVKKRKRHRHKKKAKEMTKPVQRAAAPTNVYIGSGAAPQERAPPSYP